TDPKVAAALKRVPQGEGAALMSAANYMYLAMGMVDKMMTANLPPEIHANPPRSPGGAAPPRRRRATEAGLSRVQLPPPSSL
ncbi:MAG: hypothetical protein ACE5HK_07365, partial [Candidatus Methylomirabilales bacterium]